jgi:hypothetical protein
MYFESVKLSFYHLLRSEYKILKAAALQISTIFLLNFLTFLHFLNSCLWKKKAERNLLLGGEKRKDK